MSVNGGDPWLVELQQIANEQVARSEREGRIWSEPLRLAIADVLAGVSIPFAANRYLCTEAELRGALADPAARLVEPRSEWEAEDLVKTEFVSTPDILAGVIPVGVTLISAAPKVGKTRLLTQLALAAVTGRPLVGITVVQTPVLSLALEDGARRLRASLVDLVGPRWPTADRYTIRTTSLRLDDGGLRDIEEHLNKYPLCRLVIIDVLERVRPRGHGNNAYRLDYEALAPLQRVANLRQVAIIVVHHANQRAEVGDPFERVSGTSGLIGVVDSLVLLQRRRGDTLGTLTVSGREVQDQTIALGFEDGWWCAAPKGMPPSLLAQAPEVRALWLWLADNDGATTGDLAAQYGGRGESAVLKLLRRLEDVDLVDSLGTAAPNRPVHWQVVRSETY